MYTDFKITYRSYRTFLYLNYMFIIHTYSTASIAEFNQKLQDAKSSKSQPLSEKLTSMVEARCAIRYLTNMVCTPHELPSK